MNICMEPLAAVFNSSDGLYLLWQRCSQDKPTPKPSVMAKINFDSTRKCPINIISHLHFEDQEAHICSVVEMMHQELNRRIDRCSKNAEHAISPFRIARYVEKKQDYGRQRDLLDLAVIESHKILRVLYCECHSHKLARHRVEKAGECGPLHDVLRVRLVSRGKTPPCSRSPSG